MGNALYLKLQVEAETTPNFKEAGPVTGFLWHRIVPVTRCRTIIAKEPTSSASPTISPYKH